MGYGLFGLRTDILSIYPLSPASSVGPAAAFRLPRSAAARPRFETTRLGLRMPSTIKSPEEKNPATFEKRLQH